MKILHVDNSLVKLNSQVKKVMFYGRKKALSTGFASFCTIKKQVLLNKNSKHNHAKTLIAYQYFGDLFYPRTSDL